MSVVQEAVKAALHEPIKLDIGCGKNKKPGFYGVDIIDFEGVDMVADLRQPTWSFSRVPDELKALLILGDTFDAVAPKGEGQLYAPPLCAVFPDNSVDEVHCAHFLEHLTNLNDKWERVYFFNELYRVMKPGAVCTLVFPHWSSNRYYGDPTHKEPFSEMGFLYLNKAWRLQHNNAPHTDISVNPNGYSCDFDFTQGYNLHPGLANRNQDYIQHAMTFWKEACTDIIATLTKPLQPR